MLVGLITAPATAWCRLGVPPNDYRVAAAFHSEPGGAMRYLCLIYDDETRLAARSTSEADAFTGEYVAFTQAIRKSGHYLAGEALESVQTATTVRVRRGQVSTTDGPFAETKEQLGGFYLIDARDLNEAIQVAARIPSARLGSVEIRPIREFGQP